MTTRATLRVTMLSDWHIGTGRGRSGGVDATVARDADGLPYLPAKTLTGILRDRAEAVAAALDGDGGDGWSQRCRRLFGSQPAIEGPTAGAPEAARLAVRAGRLAEPVRAALAGAGTGSLARALTIVKPGVAIDHRTRQARSDHLRMVELARLGAVLEAPVELADDLDDHDRALLQAAVVLADRVGGDRRRGAGRCRMRLEGMGVDWDGARSLLAGQPPEVPVADRAPAVTPSVAPAGLTDVSGTTGAVALVLRLRAPVLARARAVGNTVETHDFVPGTTVLAALARRLRAAGCDVAAAIAEGRLRVSDAVPLVGGAPGLPSSLALRRVKDAGGFESAGGIRNALADPESDVITSQLRGGFLGGFDGRTLPAHLGPGQQRVTATHNAIEDDLQRPDASVGGVYAYEALAAGTVLHIRIELDGEDRVLAALASGLRDDPDVRLGTSKKDGYGDAVVVEVRDAEPHGTVEVGGTCTAWCASDVVLVDEALRPTAGADHLARAVGDRLGTDVALDEDHVYVRPARRDGFHAAWGLPRPTIVTIAAGSTILLRVPAGVGPLPAEIHVGERTAEGFGRVLLQHPLLAAPLARLAPATSGPGISDATATAPPVATRALDGDEVEYVLTVAMAQWRERILERTYALVASTGTPSTPRASGSQQGALREALRRLGPWRPDNPGAAWHAAVGAVANRKHLWPHATWDLLGGLLTDPDRVWQLLDPGDWPTPNGPAGAADELRRRLWGEAVRVLVTEAARSHALEGLSGQIAEEPS